MSNFCKYYKQQKQVSYDSGQTWSNVVPAEYQIGDFYGESIDCQDQSIITRWVLVPGAFLCIDGDKYEKEIAEYSVDGGYTFVSYYPAVYRTGNKLESNSEICHNKWEGYYYLNTNCPLDYRWVDGRGCVYVGHHSGGGSLINMPSTAIIDPVKYVRCSSTTSTTLTQSDVSYNPYILYEGFIGDCVISIGDETFRDCSGLTSMTIPDTVTSIGNYAFRSCTSLESIDIPSGVTSIGYGAFYYCTGLTSITVRATTPPTLGSEQGYGVFAGSNCPIYVPCESVNVYKYTSGWRTYESRINGIPPCDTPPAPQLKLYASYTGGTTYGIACNSSTTLTQSEVRENSVSYKTMTMATVGDCVTTIDTYAFRDCTGLTSCTIGSGVTSIGGLAFWNCTSLTSVVIPNSVTSLGSGAFQQCGLTSITIPSGSIGEGAFNRCSGLTSVSIGNGVTSIGNGVFQQCDNLATCTIGSGVTSIGSQAFMSCYSLTSIDIPDSVTTINSYTFNGCSGLTSVTIGSGVTSISGNAFYGCTGIASVTIPSGVTNIGGWAFGYCSGLTGITVEATTPPTLYDTSVFSNTNNCPIYVPCESLIAYRTASGWKYYLDRIEGIPPCIEPKKLTAINNDSSIYTVVCNSSSTLTQAEIRANDAGYESMVSAIIGDCVISTSNQTFLRCTGLTSVTIPNSVTSISDGAFYGCSSLTNIDIPSGVTSIGSSTFNGCSGLASIGIPSGVTSIGSQAFMSCYSLTSINIPSGVTSIGGSAFRQCYSLTSVNIPSGVTSIGSSTFNGCTSLTGITIPDNVTSIGTYAFNGCTSLTGITIPDNVTTIGNAAFRDCSSLTSCTIGSGVTYIGETGFRNCTSLTSITINATTPPTLEKNVYNNQVYAFDDTNNCPIYVPASSVNSYKSASDWSKYTSRIQAIP